MATRRHRLAGCAESRTISDTETHRGQHVRSHPRTGPTRRPFTPADMPIPDRLKLNLIGPTFIDFRNVTPMAPSQHFPSQWAESHAETERGQSQPSGRHFRIRSMTDRTYMTPRLARWRAATDWPLTAIAIGSLPVLLLEIDRQDLPHADRVFIDVVNGAVLAAFLVDYIVELALARNRSSYVRREWTSLLIVVAQAIALVPALTAFGVLRAFRGARVLRIVVVVFRALAIGGTAARMGAN